VTGSRSGTAQYVYPKIKSYGVCTYIYWNINPKSDNHNYWNLGPCSGWVSRITLWIKSQHPGCCGV
jgi:hypothetical protein